METVLLARNSGEDFLKNGVAHLKKASEICNPLKKALDTWKDVKFDFESTDTADPRAETIVEVLVDVLNVASNPIEDEWFKIGPGIGEPFEF